jgi:hypothetical protein
MRQALTLLGCSRSRVTGSVTRISEIYLCRCSSRKDPRFKLQVLSDRQDDLAGVLALFQIGLRLAGLRERKALVHMGADPAIRDALQ